MCLLLKRWLRFSVQADGRYVGEYLKHETPSGRDVYWLTGNLSLAEPTSERWDVPLQRGYATVVPCNIDVTDYHASSSFNIGARAFFLSFLMKYFLVVGEAKWRFARLI